MAVRNCGSFVLNIHQGNALNTFNPYEAPKAQIAQPIDNASELERMAGAQKLVIYALLAYIGGALVRTALGPVGILLLLAAMVLGVVGSFKLCSNLGFSTPVKVILMILLFVPLIGLIVLLVLNSKATARLRDAGYKVGLLGATR
jgi:hypothetical protein